MRILLVNKRMSFICTANNPANHTRRCEYLPPNKKFRSVHRTSTFLHLSVPSGPSSSKSVHVFHLIRTIDVSVFLFCKFNDTVF